MDEQKAGILVVESEAAHAERIRRAFESHANRFHLQVVGSLRQARTHLAHNQPALLLARLRLPDGLGTELLSGETECPACPLVVMTDRDDEQAAIESLRAGALDYVVKSDVTWGDLPRIAERALREWDHIIKRLGAEQEQQPTLTEALQAAQALRESEEKYRTLVERSLQAIVIVQGLPPRLVFANPMCSQLTGYSVEELLSFSPKRMQALVYAKDRAAVFGRVPRLLRAQPLPSGYELRIVCKDGTLRWVQTLVGRIHYQGKLALQASLLDITDRKRAEESLRESEARYRSLFEHVPVGLYRTTPDGRFLDANPALVDMLGYPDRDCLLALDAHNLYVNPEARTRWRMPLEQQGTLHNYEVQLRKYDGTPFWGRDTARCVRDDRGQVRYFEGSLEDITERRHLEQQIEERTLYLESLLDCAPDAIVTLDAQHRILEWNRGAEDLFGYSFQEAWQQDIDHLIAAPGSGVLQEAKDLTRRLLNGQPILPFETVRYRQDGRPVHVIVAGAPIQVRDELVGVVAVYTDITGRKESEAEIRRLKEFNESIVQNMTEGIAVEDADGYFTFVNPAAAKMVGYEPEELLGQHWTNFTPPDQHPIVHAAVERRLHGEWARYEVELQRRDGSRFPVLISGSPRVDAEQGHSVGTLLVFTDITARKESEEEIRRRAAYLEALNTITAAAAAAPDLLELLETALDRILEALGLKVGAIWLGTAIVRRGLPEAAEGVAGQIAQTSQLAIRDTIIVADWQQLPAHDSLIALAPMMRNLGLRASVTVPIVAEKQRIGGLNVATHEPRSWSTQDLALVEAVGHQVGTTAERLQLLEQVQHQAEELERSVVRMRELDLMKSEFMQNVSHELRTPLSLICGYADLLVDGELGSLDPVQRGSIETIVRQARVLSTLVEDITLITVTEARTMEKMPVALEELVRVVVDDFQLRASQAGLSLETEIVPQLPLVNGGPVYLGRVLDNLLSNAIKFTPAGGQVTVRLWSEEGHILLQVADTGIGISRDKQERIFDRFYQVDGSMQRYYGGVGLGLALVKEIVEIHDGTVSVDSAEGQGSVFTITLPAMQEFTVPSQ
jgi:PAS domain S-box-containing protein